MTAAVDPCLTFLLNFDCYAAAGPGRLTTGPPRAVVVVGAGSRLDGSWPVVDPRVRTRPGNQPRPGGRGGPAGRLRPNHGLGSWLLLTRRGPEGPPRRNRKESGSRWTRGSTATQRTGLHLTHSTGQSRSVASARASPPLRNDGGKVEVADLRRLPISSGRGKRPMLVQRERVRSMGNLRPPSSAPTKEYRGSRREHAARDRTSADDGLAGTRRAHPRRAADPAQQSPSSSRGDIAAKKPRPSGGTSHSAATR
jgi:hypothetical protein